MSEYPEWLDDLIAKDERKGYAHFDYRTTLGQCVDKVSNPQFVRTYAFYPVIQKELRRIKWKDGIRENDPRLICYAAHMDRCIYKYYGGLLNNRYNRLAIELGIDNAAIAYRTNHPGKSNCEYAEQAFRKIRKHDECYVCTGDFKGFFDTLDHKHLKNSVRLLFEDGRIPDDYYHVLKAATHYTICKIESLLTHYDLPVSRSGIKELNEKSRLLKPKELRELSSKIMSSPWKTAGAQGIPQGLPISGVLANIYMIDFDYAMAQAADRTQGFYMRYSDDFIFICPTQKGFQDLQKTLQEQASLLPTLKIHQDKTKYFYCFGNKITLLEADLTKKRDQTKIITYLGFTFDGRNVRIRQSTIGKFYRKTYRKVKNTFRGGQASRKRVEQLYIDSSNWGKCANRNRRVKKNCGREDKHGNFLSYADRAARVFPDDPILKDTQKHKRKIRARSRRVLAEVDMADKESA